MSTIARELGISFGTSPTGPLNAITDVQAWPSAIAPFARATSTPA
ncbi:hypothetical protein EDC40_101740 [Aminobacter aminovorans]|uniref:Uncharacterized protein n=1 Tax=Aminobacter aminovorans TaxID=83263 RepID=A0A380WQN4_AMIAI|nr:hypothetical protein EDC40_101740 [Aminobacter aminovorans]SUU91269.1 Uncharacterised protein [Aminobacter aminovorans]